MGGQQHGRDHLDHYNAYPDRFLSIGMGQPLHLKSAYYHNSCLSEAFSMEEPIWVPS